eukprot:jgi/Chrzof1/11734/Cz06g07140.t1
MQVDYVLAAVVDARVQAQAKLDVSGRQAHDVINVEWLQLCDEFNQVMPIMPHHYLFLSTVTRLKTAKERMDIHGDPFYEDVDAADVQHLIDHLMHERAWRDAQAVAQAAADQQEQEDEDLQQVSDDGPMTANDIIIHVEQQLQQQGLADSCASMFLGCNLLFITPSTNQQASAVAAGAVTPTIAAAAAASSTPAGVVGSVQVKAEPDITSTIMPAAPSGLLSGVWDAVSVAMQWRMKAALQQVENIKLQVMSVFGTVHRSSNM